jgi:Flp pilus assembly protein TadD
LCLSAEWKRRGSMTHRRVKLMVVVGVIAALASVATWARGNLTIDLPRRSELSPVQRLNRQGVEAVSKHEYEKAEALFLKAYLYDPSDPFTLNNLGYISELEGKLDQAHRFYELASEQGSSASIDLSSAKSLEGKPMKAALEGLQNLPMRINQFNVEAMRLLSEDRGFEAVALLEKARSLDPQNPFTLNNLGVANETIGDQASALKYYRAAADTNSSDPVLVTENRYWRGRPVGQMAAANANRLQKQLEQTDPNYAQSLMLNLRGVHAENENDWQTARQDFIQAYSLDPNNAFSINNRGYVAEEDGDLESAEFFYEKARRASDSNALIGLATDSSADGKTISAVASDSNRKVDGALAIFTQERRSQTGPIELTPRFNAPGQQPPAAPQMPANPGNQNPDAPQDSAPKSPH